jgi:hypothetical protein
MAVWLGAGLSAACDVSIEEIPGELAAAGEPAASPAAAPGPLGPLLQRAYLKASNTGPSDYFGISLALSADGSTLAVGAWGEDSAAAGGGGSQADDSADNAGAVYVFTRRGTTWIQEAYLKASHPDAYGSFGYSLALSADGSTLAVGATGEAAGAAGTGGDQPDGAVPYAGAVHVFTRRGVTWRQEAHVQAPYPGAYDFFGYSVALSADGATLAVSAPYEDSAAAGVGGSGADDSALDAGAAYVFARSGATWRQQAYVKAGSPEAYDFFGYRVALSADGATLAVSAPYEDSAAAGVGGDQADNSAESAGAAYVFTRSGATWCQAAYVKASNPDVGDNFGGSLALSADGSTLAVGALYESSAATGIDGDQGNTTSWAGAVYVLARSGATWRQEAYVKASNTDEADLFGSSLALSADGSILAVGAQSEDSAAAGIGGDGADDSLPSAGAVYVLARSGTTWRHEVYAKAGSPGEMDQLGYSVGLSGDGATLAVGAPFEDSAATGIDGNEEDESAEFAGAVYVFDRRRR